MLDHVNLILCLAETHALKIFLIFRFQKSTSIFFHIFIYFFLSSNFKNQLLYFFTFKIFSYGNKQIAKASVESYTGFSGTQTYSSFLSKKELLSSLNCFRNMTHILF